MGWWGWWLILVVFHPLYKYLNRSVNLLI
jgi:hypothetical protein